MTKSELEGYILESKLNNQYMIERGENGKCKLFCKMQKKERVKSTENVIQDDDIADGRRWLYLFESGSPQNLTECVTNFRNFKTHMEKAESNYFNILRVAKKGAGNAR